MYVAFVSIVLIADVYHRAVTVPRARREDAMRERRRQLEAERIASQLAGDALNALFEAAAAAEGGGGEEEYTVKMAAWGGGGKISNQNPPRSDARHRPPPGWEAQRIRR
jgi:hypothetical protein